MIDEFAAAFARKGVERFDASHVADVVGLIDQLGPRPKVLRRSMAFRAERRRLAERIIAWCPSPERLARWLVRVSQRFGVDNLAGYLRRAAAKGDPGTVLDSVTAPPAELSPATEKALEGPKMADSARTLAAAALAADAGLTSGAQARMQQDLRRLWALGQRDGARHTLLELLGDERDDDALRAAVGDAMPLAAARKLLEVA
ncbi:MAG: hypothetical protein NXI31_10845 [bacterium]|nr:hypothetical protein [bacterium]